MPPRALGVSVIGLALLCFSGCKQLDDPGYGAAPACNDPEKCKGLAVGGGEGATGAGGGTSSSGGAGGATAGRLTGNVGLIADKGFGSTIPFNGKASIYAPKAGGGQQKVDYTDAVTGFDLE